MESSAGLFRYFCSVLVFSEQTVDIRVSLKFTLKSFSILFLIPGRRSVQQKCSLSSSKYATNKNRSDNVKKTVQFVQKLERV
jgi:hypothetical protein